MPVSKTALEGTADLVAEGIAGNTITVLDWSRGVFGEIDLTALQNSLVDASDAVNKGDLGGADDVDHTPG